MERKPLPPEIVEGLKRPLPSEAISKHPTKSYLSSIKAIYVIERLNELFGIGGWTLTDQVVSTRDVADPKAPGVVTKTWVVVKVKLCLVDYGVTVEAYGGNDNVDLGDAYKGAVTDALTKACSSIYLGMDVYKGHGEQASREAERAEKEAAEQAQAEVRDRKIAEAKQQPVRQTAPASGTESAQVQNGRVTGQQGQPLDYFSLLSKFKTAKETIGEENYYRILGAFGYEKSNQIPNSKDGVSQAKAILREMGTCAADMEKQGILLAPAEPKIPLQYGPS